jgi:uncharacterized cupredoxin-like copper-binding protein
MRRGTRWTIVLATMWLAGSLAVAGYAFAAGEPPATRNEQVLGPGEATVTLHLEHSRFVPSRIVVREHTTVTFVIVNDDPITHELIVGDDAVHALHESGTHGVHGDVPGEVTVLPGMTGTTSFTFHESGTVLFACHLPKHFAYGMVGDVIVKPSDS